MSDSINKPMSEFRDEDFEKINEEYFKNIRNSRKEIIDPSGWQDTFTPVQSYLDSKDKFIHKYNTDLGEQLKPEKKIAQSLLNKWDLFDYSTDNFTFCHSVTVGSLIVLSSLSKLGIKTIFFETPCYYATIYQAEDLGFNVILLPTYYENNFEISPDIETLKRESPFVIWITQPHTALGYNQNKDNVNKILSLLSPKDYLVVDEATEQYFPSHLADFRVSDFNIIKIRSFFKGMGLNGIRLSYIAHPIELRETIMEEMEIYQGALDIYSLDFLSKYANNISRFELMLESSRIQIQKTKQLLDVATINNNFILTSKVVNGYIGCFFLNYKDINLEHEAIREKLLKFSSNNNMPIILGSSMRFAKHENMEFIRINYFNQFSHLNKAIDKLNLFFSSVI
jgi:aspartate/methionine/tyrosine aminotransferase